MQVEYSRRKFGIHNPPYLRVFFEFSDEPASQPLPTGDANGSGGVDLQQVAFLQGQLRDKDRRIQTLSTQLAEVQDQSEQLEQQLTLARAGWVPVLCSCARKWREVVRGCLPCCVVARVTHVWLCPAT